MLAAAEHPAFLLLQPVGLDDFLTTTGARWSGVSDRRWRVRITAHGSVKGDLERLSGAMDALVENAIQATSPGDEITPPPGPRRAPRSCRSPTLGPASPRSTRSGSSSASPVRGAEPRARSGTGLGLPMVRAIAEAHGGTVAVASRDGEGARFDLRIPGFEPARGEAPRPRAATALKLVA